MTAINTNEKILKAQWKEFLLEKELIQLHDDAGSAIASKMESQVRSLGVAIRNAIDAIS